jgi:hypothetical protein
MTKILEILKMLIVIAILALLAWFVFWKAPKDKEADYQYWEALDFKTDTVHVDVDYSKLPKPSFKFDVPPNKVINYQAPEVNPYIRIDLNDSLIRVIDSLKGAITEISLLYLKLYPEAHKLIYAEFTQDTFKLDLLSTTGRIFTQVYPVDYARFQYQYKDNKVSATEVRKKASKQDMHGALFGYAGYGVTSTSPIIGLDYFVYKGKFRLGGSSFITVEQEPQFILNGTIGYKLYGRY